MPLRATLKNLVKGTDKQPEKENRKRPPPQDPKWPFQGPKETSIGGLVKRKSPSTIILDSGESGEAAKQKEVSAVPVGLDLPEKPSPPLSFISDRNPAEWRALRTRTSQDSILSFYSEKFKDPRGQPRHYLKSPNPEALKRSKKQIDKSYDHPRMLMLEAGQGGTFGYGRSYVTEKRREVSGNERWTHPDNMKHLTFFGRNIRFIGTVKCVSCVAVYFEIKGGRFFCAHINTWHDSKSFFVDNLEPGSPAQKKIAFALFDRFEKYPDEYDWTWEDAKPKTLFMVCPEPDAQARVVPEVVQAFLRLDHTPRLHHGHGFIIQPGYPGPDGRSIGLTLEVGWGTRRSDKKRVYVRDAVPEEFEWRKYQHSNGEAVLQRWCYTIGRGWHHIDVKKYSRFEKNIPVHQKKTLQQFAPYGKKWQTGGPVPTLGGSEHSFTEADYSRITASGIEDR